MTTAAILQLITLLEPEIVNIVMMIKDKKTGSLTVIAVLDSVDAQVKENQAAMATWLGTH